MGFNIRGNKSLQHDDDPNIYWHTKLYDLERSFELVSSDI